MISGKAAKQQRTDRAAKLEVVKKSHAKEVRRKKIGIGIGAGVAVAVVGSLVSVALINDPPIPAAEDIRIEGLQQFDDLSADHVRTPVEYEQAPPVGGDHSAAWLNCGIYSEPVPAENVVHSLEHGAVWVTYDPAVVDDEQIEALRDELPNTYTVLSPLEDTSSPIMASAWGAQVGLESADDQGLELFVAKYWQSPNAPEPGAACVGGMDAPGKVA